MFAGAYRGPTHHKLPMTDALLPENCANTPTGAAGNSALEHETMAAILSYRHYLSVAQRRFDRLCRLSKVGPKRPGGLARANAAYHSALEKLDAQDSHLAKLIERLGYVPKTDRKLFH